MKSKDMTTASAVIAETNRTGMALARARQIERDLSQLMVNLERFARGPRVDREVLKKIISGPYAGRVASLLSSLYDEMELAAWITFSGKEKA